VYLVRHGQAEPGQPDDLRRLTPRGREQARLVALHLDGEHARPDAVVSSPLLRARETAEEISRAFGVAAEIDERLAPGATPEDVRAAVTGRGQTVVAIGHEPDCGRAAAELAGGEERPFSAGETRLLDLTASS
jgi:phosphohistidine phosphatase SixA